MNEAPFPWNIPLLLLAGKLYFLDLGFNGGLCALLVWNRRLYLETDSEKIPKRVMAGTVLSMLAPVFLPWLPLNLAVYSLLNVYLLYCGGKLWQMGSRKAAALFWLHAGFSLLLVLFGLYRWDWMTP